MANFNKGVITPFDDAVIHDSMKGNQFEGVWAGGIFHGFGYTLDDENRTFTIAPGYGSIHGRQFELPESHQIDLIFLTGRKYCVVYFEISLKNVTRQSITIKMAYAGAGYPDLESDDLIRIKNGIARMPLYKFEYNALGGEGESFTNISNLFYGYAPGVVENVRSMDADGTLNGRILKNLLHFNADRWKVANRAVYTSLGKRIGSTEVGSWNILDDLSVPLFGNSQLVQISQGIFRVTGQLQVNEPTSAKVLNENSTYKFFYQGAAGAYNIPKNAKVIGVIVTGSAMFSQWTPGFLGLGSKWNEWKSRSAMGNHDQLDEHYSDEQMDDKLTIFGGDIYNQEIPLYLNEFRKATDLIIGVQLTTIGTKLEMNHATNISGNPVVDIARLTFKNPGTIPYIEVYVADNRRIQIDMTFRLIYLGGEMSWGKTDTNPFNSLVPALV